MVRKSASIWVGCHSSVSPLYTGTPACAASSSTSACAVAAVLDRVIHPAQHRGGVGDRLLVPQLRAGRVQVGHVRALVVGADLERRAGAGGGLLEDQRDLLAPQARSRYRRTSPSSAPASFSRNCSSRGVKSISLRKLRFFRLNATEVLSGRRSRAQNAGSRSIGQVMQWPPPRPLPSSNPSIVMTSMPGLAQRGVGAGVALVGHHHPGLERDHVVAVVPLLALGLEACRRRSR